MLYAAGSDRAGWGNPSIYGYVFNTLCEIDPFGLVWKDILSKGLGHHLFPRSVAKKLGVKELSVLKAISWYPNIEAGSGELHQKLHRLLVEKGIPYHGSKFTGTLDDFWELAEQAYGGIKEKGYLKVPYTDEKLYKNLRPKEALKKIRILFVFEDNERKRS